MVVVRKLWQSRNHQLAMGITRMKIKWDQSISSFLGTRLPPYSHSVHTLQSFSSTATASHPHHGRPLRANRGDRGHIPCILFREEQLQLVKIQPLPHFHVLLTVNHYSLLALDYYKMSGIFEQLFKGTHDTQKDRFMLYDSNGANFMTDNENAYVDVRLYPQDNWNTVIANYVRKSAVPNVLTALQQTHGAQE